MKLKYVPVNYYSYDQENSKTLITAVLRSYQEKFQLDLYLEVFYGLYTKK